MRELSMAELEAETVSELPERNLMRFHRHRRFFVRSFNTCSCDCGFNRGFNTFGGRREFFGGRGFDNGFGFNSGFGFDNGFGGANAFAFNGSGANAASQNAFVTPFQFGGVNTIGAIGVSQGISQSNTPVNIAI